MFEFDFVGKEKSWLISVFNILNGGGGDKINSFEDRIVVDIFVCFIF